VEAEVAVYAHQLRSIVDRLLAAVEPLSEDELNRAPPIEGANSPYVLVAHVLGNLRAWVLGIACGRPLGRDRPGEFASSGPYGALAAAARELFAEADAALESLTADDLARRLAPSQELWGEGPPYELSVRQVFIEAIEHAAVHLGELHVTLDLARMGTAS
jgi:uncharacterized damage-inducible protein DinB